ncbi:MAG TPA: pyridoxamine 5'-phosphate oxidase family protein [Puia sp.]|jgi:general stress protein 26|nr:pyridoxamine 5'-phosphate oxidase family protein [Puia sp.]
MSEQSYLHDKQAIRKLQDLATEINICLFCSGVISEEREGCRPMSTSGVDEEGSIWFMSDRKSAKNREITMDPHVKLYYSHPGKSSFLVVVGTADIVYDREKIRELWTPLDRSWFSDGENDPAISLIRVRPQHAHYWDARGNRMVNFFSLVAKVATGKALVEGEEGDLMISRGL